MANGNGKWNLTSMVIVLSLAFCAGLGGSYAYTSGCAKEARAERERNKEGISEMSTNVALVAKSAENINKTVEKFIEKSEEDRKVFFKLFRDHENRLIKLEK